MLLLFFLVAIGSFMLLMGMSYLFAGKFNPRDGAVLFFSCLIGGFLGAIGIAPHKSFKGLAVFLAASALMFSVVMLLIDWAHPI